MTVKKKETFVAISRGSLAQQKARRTLVQLFQHCPLSTEDHLANLGLFVRSPLMANVLYLNELYHHMVHLPGIIMEFGCWLGKNLVTFASMRAIHEPYNFTRKVVGFDTFVGYPPLSTGDRRSGHLVERGYAVPNDYPSYLRKLLDYHERENPMSHIKKYEVVAGDVRKTLPRYLKHHPQTIIALAYCDMALYEPTKAVLEMILPYMIPGSVIALDELNQSEFAGETVAFREVFHQVRYRARRSQFLPDRTYVILET